MRIIQILVIFFSLVACHNPKDELIGHWQLSPHNGENYYTLDITDSTTQVNKYHYENPHHVFPRYNYAEETIVIDYEPYIDFELIGDTLYVGERLKFVKYQKIHHLDDRFPGSLVHLNLPKSNENCKTSLPYRNSLLVDIFIGPLKESISITGLSNPDSTCFQTWDFLASSYKDLQLFAQYEDDKISENENFWLIIHADSSTSKATIDTLISLIEPLGVTNGFILSSYDYELDQMMFEELE